MVFLGLGRGRRGLFVVVGAEGRKISINIVLMATETLNRMIKRNSKLSKTCQNFFKWRKLLLWFEIFSFSILMGFHL